MTINPAKIKPRPVAIYCTLEMPCPAPDFQILRLSCQLQGCRYPLERDPNRYLYPLEQGQGCYQYLQVLDLECFLYPQAQDLGPDYYQDHLVSDQGCCQDRLY